MTNHKPKNNKTLVLDLDSTLVHTSGDMNEYINLQIFSNPSNAALRSRTYSFELVDVVDPPGTGATTPMWGVYRPHFREFMVFALSYFGTVKVWSAGQFKYVHAISDLVFKDLPHPESIKTFDDCKKTTNRIYKPLKSYCRMGELCDLSQYLILDDRSDTFDLNKQNGVEIPPYEPAATYQDIMKDDIALLQFMGWLSLPEVLASNNLSTLDKSKIFTTPLNIYSYKAGGGNLSGGYKNVGPNIAPFSTSYLDSLSKSSF
jgi:hypothetical protein